MAYNANKAHTRSKMAISLPIEIPTDTEIRQRFKGARHLKIERDFRGVTVSMDESCLSCGKVHQRKWPASKTVRKCNLKIVSTVYAVVKYEGG